MRKVSLSVLLLCVLLCALSCEKNEANALKTDQPEETTEITSEEATEITPEKTTEIATKEPITNTPTPEASSQSERKQIHYKFLYDEEYWEKYDLTNAIFKTKEDYEEAVVNYIEEIAELYHMEDWYEQYTKNKDTFYIRLSIEDMPYGGRSDIPVDYTMNSLIVRIIFTDSMFTQNYAPLVHELTHIVTTDKDKDISSFSRSLTEGICEYAGSKIGDVDSAKLGIDVHTLYKYCMNACINQEIYTKEEVDNIIAMVGEECVDYPVSVAENIGGTWILCSHSFVDYLINTYGMDEMLKILRAEDENIYYNYNVDGLTGLKLEWQNFLEDYEPVLSDEEIENYLKNPYSMKQD